MSRVRHALHHPRFAMVAALVTVVYFVAEWVVAATWRGHYGYRDDQIGPLGVPFCGPEGNRPCSALYPLMDVALVITGLAVAAVALSWMLRRAATAAHGLLLMAAGVGLAVAGAVTERGDYALHTTALTAFLVFGPVAIFLIGSSRSPSAAAGFPCGAMRFAAVAGLAGTAGYFAYVGGYTSLLGPGGTQRLVVYSVLIALIVVSCSARRPAVTDSSDPPATGAEPAERVEADA